MGKWNYTATCDICGKKRSIGNHSKCSRIRQAQTDNHKSKSQRKLSNPIVDRLVDFIEKRESE